jgi:hypothetical protein
VKQLKRQKNGQGGKHSNKLSARKVLDYEEALGCKDKDFFGPGALFGAEFGAQFRISRA